MRQSYITQPVAFKGSFSVLFFAMLQRFPSILSRLDLSNSTCATVISFTTCAVSLEPHIRISILNAASSLPWCSWSEPWDSSSWSINKKQYEAACENLHPVCVRLGAQFPKHYLVWSAPAHMPPYAPLWLHLMFLLSHPHMRFPLRPLCLCCGLFQSAFPAVRGCYWACHDPFLGAPWWEKLEKL